MSYRDFAARGYVAYDTVRHEFREYRGLFDEFTMKGTPADFDQMVSAVETHSRFRDLARAIGAEDPATRRCMAESIAIVFYLGGEKGGHHISQGHTMLMLLELSASGGLSRQLPAEVQTLADFVEYLATRAADQGLAIRRVLQDPGAVANLERIAAANADAFSADATTTEQEER